MSSILTEAGERANQSSCWGFLRVSQQPTLKGNSYHLKEQGARARLRNARKVVEFLDICFILQGTTLMSPGASKRVHAGDTYRHLGPW